MWDLKQSITKFAPLIQSLMDDLYSENKITMQFLDYNMAFIKDDNRKLIAYECLFRRSGMSLVPKTKQKIKNNKKRDEVTDWIKISNKMWFNDYIKPIILNFFSD